MPYSPRKVHVASVLLSRVIHYRCCCVGRPPAQEGGENEGGAGGGERDRKDVQSMLVCLFVSIVT